MNKISQIISLLQKEFPAVKPKPRKSDPLDTLIATMLSQNTTDKTSYRAFVNLKNDIGSWEDVMKAPLGKIKNAVRVCGLTNQKSSSIKNMLKQMNSKYGRLSLNHIKKSGDDEIYKELLQYKGVGIKTISCVLAFSLGRDVFAVDTHVHRVCNRLGLVNTKMPDKTFQEMRDKIPAGRKLLFHRLLILFGRKICRSANPLCGKCALYDLCEFNDKEYYAMKEQAEAKDNNFIILEHV